MIICRKKQIKNSQVKILPDKVKSKCLLPVTRQKENCRALTGLRNAVMHNKFLLLYRGYDICYVEGVDANKSAGFKANLLNIFQTLLWWKATIQAQNLLSVFPL